MRADCEPLAWQAVFVRNPTLLLAALLVVVLVGCSGIDAPSDDQAPADRLAEAKQSFDEADYVGFTLATEELPSGLEGLLSAEGVGTHAPAFKGEVEVQTALDIIAPLIAVDGDVYAQLPFAGWSELDPAAYGAPDPAELMDKQSGISSLFTATRGLSDGESERSGEKVLTSIEGTLPGEAVKQVFPSSGTDDFAVTYTLTGENALDKITVSGPFYAGFADVTYTIDLNLDAESVEIEAPI